MTEEKEIPWWEYLNWNEFSKENIEKIPLKEAREYALKYRKENPLSKGEEMRVTCGECESWLPREFPPRHGRCKRIGKTILMENASCGYGVQSSSRKVKL